MSFVLTEEQESIQRTARAFACERLPVAHLRRLRDTKDETGFSRVAWSDMARLGLAGTILPERHGGSGLGFAELGLVMEECGRTLAPTPFLSTVLLAARAILLAGSEAQQDELLRGVSEGTRILAFASEEGSRHAPHRVATRLERSATGTRLTGEKVFVLDGHVADMFVVVARSSGDIGAADGLSLVVVPASQPGVRVQRTSMIDSRNAARVSFDGVPIPDHHVLGPIGRAAGTVDRVLDGARVGLAAEMLGGAREAFERTLAYLKTRKQFGAAIGSFQALKHRASTQFIELELTRSIVLEGLRAIDEERSDVPLLASAAKARATDTFLLVAAEAVQMHGGIGVTDELDIGFFLKRARAAEMTLGDAAFHRDRYARILGY